MGKFDGILICVDLDGTLLRDDKSISDENINAIEYFKKEGGYFTFITGRMPYFVKDIYEKINPNAAFGCINGGGIYDHRKGEYVWALPISDSVIDLVEYADERVPGIGIQINTLERIYFSRENSAMAEFREETGNPNLVKHYREVDEPIAKIVFGDKRESAILKLSEVLFSHPRASEFDFIRSCETLYEILPKGVSKGSVLPKIAEHLGIDMKRTCAMGDYSNDIEMIKAAGVGVAVGNAIPEVKAIADYVTVTNEEHAVARVIFDIESGKIKF